jgi:hypothetical protein
MLRVGLLVCLYTDWICQVDVSARSLYLGQVEMICETAMSSYEWE